MTPYRQVRATFTARTVVVYQAFNDAIADAALAAGHFVPPFSVGRMTWVKPSFLWMMERCGWATKSNQERVLAIALERERFEQLLHAAVLTHYEPAMHSSPEAWRQQLEQATVHVQWDPERSARGEKLAHRSLQLGLSRHVASSYATSWVQHLEDVTPLVAKLRALRREGKHDAVRRALPTEHPYPLPPALAARLGCS